MLFVLYTAYKALANHIFQGRLLQVLAAKPLPTEVCGALVCDVVTARTTIQTL